MNLAKQFVYRFVPPAVHNNIVSMKDTRALGSIPKLSCDASNLRAMSSLSLEGVFTSSETADIWSGAKNQIDLFDIPDGTGGVNMGDRRAIHYLVSQLSPESVLEVGTHIGASTLHIASALYATRIRQGKNASLTTVDAADVNSTTKKPWLRYGSSQSPVDMITRLNYGSFVRFVTDTSLNFAAHCTEKFDFIFLDGDHGASTVYQEVPAALRLLKPNGIILLHDYFPLCKPLWSNGTVVPGPYLAIARLVREGAPLVALPLGQLPWPTKLGSNVTSLALLARKA